MPMPIIAVELESSCLINKSRGANSSAFFERPEKLILGFLFSLISWDFGP